MNAFDPNIPNFAFYNSEMKKAMFDKLFFMDKINADIIVDYGCADGTMIGMMKALFPNKTYIGFDISDEMIALAKKTPATDSTLYTSNWDEVVDELEFHKFRGVKSALVMSSLLHEVYSYSTKEDIYAIKHGRVFSGLFDYICIRDMHYKSGHSLNNMENLAKMFRTIDLKKIKEFEAEFGPITYEQNFLHLLLKYRYDDNWAHELKEDYFAYREMSFSGGFVGPGQFYQTIYREEFCPLFIKNIILKDTGIDIKNTPTHLKVIYGRT